VGVLLGGGLQDQTEVVAQAALDGIVEREIEDDAVANAIPGNERAFEGVLRGLGAVGAGTGLEELEAASTIWACAGVVAPVVPVVGGVCAWLGLALKRRGAQRASRAAPLRPRPQGWTRGWPQFRGEGRRWDAGLV
jgi:hypothetical protein